MVSPQKPDPLDYFADAPAERPAVTSVGMTTYLGIVATLVIVAPMMVLPAFEPVFADLAMELPWFTSQWLKGQHWLTHLPGLLVLAAIPVVAPMLIMRLSWSPGSQERTRRRLRLMSLAVTLTCGLIVLVTALALFLPLITIMTSLTRSP